MKGFFALVDTSVQDAEADLSGKFTCVTLAPPFDPKLLEDAEVVFVVSVSAFVAVADSLLDWDGIVIIFDAPVKCEALVGITLIDVEKRDASFRYRFRKMSRGDILASVTRALKENQDIIFHQRKDNLLPYLLGQTSNSQMDKLQTWKYRIPPELRDRMFGLVVKWFIASKPTIEDLKNKLFSTLGTTKSKPIDNLFEGNRFSELKAAIQKVLEQKTSGKSFSVDKIALAFGVSPFDIRYLLTSNEKMKKVTVFNPPLEIASIQRAYRLNKPSPLDLNDETDNTPIEAN